MVTIASLKVALKKKKFLLNEYNIAFQRIDSSSKLRIEKKKTA